jgi:hypothetical protein
MCARSASKNKLDSNLLQADSAIVLSPSPESLSISQPGNPDTTSTSLSNAFPQSSVGSPENKTDRCRDKRLKPADHQPEGTNRCTSEYFVAPLKRTFSVFNLCRLLPQQSLLQENGLSCLAAGRLKTPRLSPIVQALPETVRPPKSVKGANERAPLLAAPLMRKKSPSGKGTRNEPKSEPESAKRDR